MGYETALAAYTKFDFTHDGRTYPVFLFDLKKRDHCTIHVSSSGMFAGSFTELFSRVMLRSWSDRSLIWYSGRTHGVTEAECAVRELKRIPSSRQGSGPPSGGDR